MKGDLLELGIKGKFDVIVHGCNCFHTFGAGIATQIKLKFPLVFEIDKRTPYGDKNKLGTISFCKIDNLVIVNAYTQYGYGTGKKQINYLALRNCFKCIKKQFYGLRIGYPKIGAGLAGGNWEIIQEIINEELLEENHTLVEYWKIN